MTLNNLGRIIRKIEAVARCQEELVRKYVRKDEK